MVLREGGCVVGRRKKILLPTYREKKMREFKDKVLCIYHGNCADGFTAAWVVRKFFGEDRVEFVPGVYQNEPPDCRGRDVIIVDFSYKLPVITQMVEYCESMLIIDHHASAVEDLRSLVKCPHDSFRVLMSDPLCEGGVYTVFDTDRSGAGLAWDFFFPTERRPRLVDHVEDRDLWRFRVPGTRRVQANIFSYEYDFDLWDKLVEQCQHERSHDLMIYEGGAIERKHHKDIRELLGVVTRTMIIGGYVVPVANLPYTMTSDAGNLLSKVAPFAACYWDTPEGRVFSLRSQEGGIDVSKIAATYGGGGHPTASGFRLPHDELENKIPVVSESRSWLREEIEEAVAEGQS